MKSISFKKVSDGQSDYIYIYICICIYVSEVKKKKNVGP